MGETVHDLFRGASGRSAYIGSPPYRSEHVQKALAWINAARAVLDRAELKLVGILDGVPAEQRFPQVEAMLRVAEHAATQAFYAVGDAALALQVEKENAATVDRAAAGRTVPAEQKDGGNRVP